MNGVIIVDTNLLVLLVVGSTSPEYITRHKRLSGYSVEDFQLLCLIISQYDEIALVAHVLSEVSGLCRQIAGPARRQIGHTFRELIRATMEIPIPSIAGAQRPEFETLGLTDSILLQLCTMRLQDVAPTLITADSALADHANALGGSVIDYQREFRASRSV